MKVQKVKGIMCPECEAFVSEFDLPPVAVLYQCGECEEVYEDRDEAKDCCKE